MALCRRYGLRPYRYKRQRHATVMVRVPQTFLDNVLWPEFLQIDEALQEHIAEITDRIIRSEVYHAGGAAEEVDEPAMRSR